MQFWNYELIKDAYLTQGGFQDGSYLEPFPRETQERINSRRKLAVNINLVRRITLSLTGHLFRKSPIRNVNSKAYLRFMEDTDTKGTYIDTFMKKVFRLGLLYGTVFILIDKPPIKIKTQKEKELLKAFPYATVRLPWHLHSYKTDQRGKLTEITFKETTPENKTLYRTFTTKEWKISQETETLAQGEHNLLSELHSVLRDTAFPIFTFPLSDSQDIEKIQNQPLTLGTENAIAYQPQGSAKPDFIAPPPEPVNQLLETIKFLIEKAYEHANLNFQGGVQKSGIAKEYEYLEFSKMLSDFAQSLEECEYRIAHLVCKWEEEEFDGWIEYSKSFTPLDVEKYVSVLLQVIDDPNVPQEIKSEALKKLSRFILSDTLDEQKLSELDRSIDAQEDFEGKLREEWNTGL